MRKKQEEVAAPGAPAWMATMADMMTLLLTFFILLFAMSTVDAEKYRAFVSSFDGGSGVLDGEATPGDQLLIEGGMTQLPDVNNSSSANRENQYKRKKLQAMETEIKEHLAGHNLEQKVEVDNTGEYISIKFDDILLFDTGKANLKPGAIPVLDKVGIILDKYLENPELRLGFEGHTDNIPINTVQFPSNWELSAARAIAVAKFYIEELGFNPGQVSTEGFGQHVPIESNDTPQGRAANRRVEIKIINEPNR